MALHDRYALKLLGLDISPSAFRSHSSVAFLASRSFVFLDLRFLRVPMRDAVVSWVFSAFALFSWFETCSPSLVSSCAAFVSLLASFFCPPSLSSDSLSPSRFARFPLSLFFSFVVSTCASCVVAGPAHPVSALLVANKLAQSYPAYRLV